ncbi:MAG: uncharacterized membrane protein YbhN (UPF0104 family) [Planctomycetota bacterium]|jgi:uncharacterized membrane protein YbhN (UPF0104 family)
MRKITQLVITAILFLSGSLYLYINREHLSVLGSISAGNLALLTLVTFSFFCASGYTFKILVGVLEVRMNLTETIGLSILSNFSNYIMPGRPGAALKAVYLKTTKRLEYSKFTAVLAANMFLALFMMGISGALLIPMTSDLKEGSGLQLLFICMIIMIVSVLPFVTRLPNITLEGRKGNILRSAFEGFILIRSNKKKLFSVCMSFLLQFVLAAFTIKIAYSSLGLSITLLSAMLIGVFTAIANLFTITPNNIGIQELVIAYLVTIVGLDFANGIIGAGLMRIVHIVITLALTPIFSFFLLRRAGISLNAQNQIIE